MTNSVQGQESGPEPGSVVPDSPAPPEIGVEPPRGSLSAPLLYPGLVGEVPKNHLVNALLSVFLCHPFGGVAIYYAMRVERLWMLGEHERSRHASRRAKGWAITAHSTGGLLIVAVVAFYAMLFSRTLLR